ncbi:MAG: toll/interleukin-1 receptor domain-containing protein, partial [Cyanobacteria bacterium J06649_11]
NLFNLVLGLYAIPLNHASFKPLRKSLHKQWEQTLSHLPTEETTFEKRPLKVFISYAHEDEAQFKHKFLNMLGGLQRQGLIDAWEDRQIRPGDDWYAEIQKAMNACDMAVLLVSSDFINSRFINEEEVPKLLKRRQAEGMRVVPIIIRPCLWTSEPMFSGLQSLPKDGKPVITFPNDNGERDQAWTDIAKKLEEFAKKLQEEKGSVIRGSDLSHVKVIRSPLI